LFIWEFEDGGDDDVYTIHHLGKLDAVNYIYVSQHLDYFFCHIPKTTKKVYWVLNISHLQNAINTSQVRHYSQISMSLDSSSSSTAASYSQRPPSPSPHNLLLCQPALPLCRTHRGWGRAARWQLSSRRCRLACRLVRRRSRLRSR
jgi:hypothetical protein